VLLQWQIINNKGIDMALGIIRTRITAIETRRVKAPEKTADSIYHSPEYRRWRASVIARAGARCEHVTNGVRCTKASPVNRMFADHIVNCAMAVPLRSGQRAVPMRQPPHGQDSGLPRGSQINH
jgi:hypothetical protein